MRVAAPLLAICALLLSPDLDAQTRETRKAKEAKAPAAPTANCQNSCVVTVNLAAGCGSGIRVSMDPITVPRGNTTTITWNFVPASPTGWKFPANGIVIQGFDAFAKRNFTKGPPTLISDHTITVVHTNDGPAAFKYDINLVKGTETCTLDPTIVDQ